MCDDDDKNSFNGGDEDEDAYTGGGTEDGRNDSVGSVCIDELEVMVVVCIVKMVIIKISTLILKIIKLLNVKNMFEKEKYMVVLEFCKKKLAVELCDGVKTPKIGLGEVN